jgi:putative copper export protein
LKQFVQWLSTTSPSLFIQNHNAWVIPTVQSIHIVGIAIIVGSIFMIDLRIFEWAGTDQTLGETANRFSPWITGALWLLLATGTLLVIGEPERELITFSFWAKMFLVAVTAVLATTFRSKIRKNEQQWENGHRASLKWMALLSFLILLFIIVLGRLIAYDHVWGRWSPATKA